MAVKFITIAIIASVPFYQAMSFEKLLDAIAQVESGGDRSAFNKDEKAHGVYQMTQGVIDDVNNFVLKKKVYTIDDAYEPENAHAIAVAYMQYWGRKYKKRTHRNPTPEVYARIWNGGPRGYEKESTLSYWERVKNLMEVE